LAFIVKIISGKGRVVVSIVSVLQLFVLKCNTPPSGSSCNTIMSYFAAQTPHSNHDNGNNEGGNNNYNNNTNNRHGSSSRREIETVAWDPKSPATLMIPHAVTGDDGHKEFRMDTIFSHRGVSCSTFESSALMKLLDIRDAYMKSGDSGESRAMRNLSRNYRKVLRECIQEWKADIEAKRGDAIEDEFERDIVGPSEEEESVELLVVTEAVTQLSETFLLLPEGNYPVFDSYEDTMNLPGAVTADTIRYLRIHSLGDAVDLFDESILEEIDNSYQPDQFNGGKEYWELIEAHLIRGCLEGKRPYIYLIHLR
jgi:hypothetical protein